MSILFSDKPGARERHLKRQYQNPLFGMPEISMADIERAQQEDAAEVDQFMNQFRDIVQQAATLDANAEADVVLKIKEQLDKSYEQCCGLAGDQSEVKAMLKRLVEVIMQAMWNGIGQDAQAHSKLQMEIQARQSHYAMLENTLIADLLRPDSPIGEDDLVASLLSESSEAVRAAMHIFVPEQQAVLCQQAHLLLEKLDKQSHVYEQASKRLEDMDALLQPSNELPG